MRDRFPLAKRAGYPATLLWTAVLMSVLCGTAPVAGAQVVINEILYHPREASSGGEFIELHNPGDAAVDLSGWSFSEGVEFRFPSGNVLGSKAYLVVCEDATAAAASYGISNIAGTYEGRLDNGGEELTLVNAAGAVVDTVRFDDLPPWPIAADGTGPSLELIQPSWDNRRVQNWSLGQPFTPGAPNAPESLGRGRVVINEIMYHPPTGNEEEEYLELYNRSGGPLDLGGWTLRNAIEYTFPAGTMLNDYLVVAKSLAAFAARYPSTTNVVGDYSGSLRNSGELVALADASGQLVDVVHYLDGGRWPEAADGEGSSLELRHPDLDNAWPAGWAASDPAESPGGANSALEADPAPLAEVIGHAPAVPAPSDSVHVTAFVNDNLSPAQATLNYRLTNVPFSNGVITEGDVWRYFKGQGEPSGGNLNWTQVAFDDASWSQGASRLGYEASDGTLLLRTQLTDMRYNYLSVYLRKTFEVSDLDAIAVLTLTVDWDDGFIAYLNGTEIVRSDMGSSGQFFAFDDPATTENHEAGTPETFDVSSFLSLLQEGTNVLAIQAHNRTLDSSDFSILPELGWSENAQSGAWVAAGMFDDGAHGDGIAGDGFFGATIPPFPQGAIVEFYGVAEDTNSALTYAPPSAPSANCLYQVDETAYLTDRPLYRVVMTEADLNTLATRDPFSDVLLNCTFIADDTVYYPQGIRYRGNSARSATPRSYRIDFDNDRSFRGTTELNLNGFNAARQILGWDLIERYGGLYPPDRRSVRLILNNAYYPRYLQIESVDGPYVTQHFPGDDEGNLYRADHTADLVYRGTDPDAYVQGDPLRPNGYIKRTNVTEWDYTDIMDLTYVFTHASEATFPGRIETLIDVPQWMRFFAIQNVLGNLEGGIYLDTGDDYFIYHRGVDDRFVMIPWDMDQAFGQSDQTVFRQTVPAVVRLVRNPAFVRHYYAGIDEALQGAFSLRAMRRSLAEMEGFLPQADLDTIDSFVPARHEYLLANIPQQLTYEGGQAGLGDVTGEILIVEGDVWRFFRGRSEPSGGNLDWATVGFNDAAWEEGPTGIGYGDGDDNTVLVDMQNNYLSVYLRKSFEVLDTGSISSLRFKVDWDDGFVAYLNGTEIARRELGTSGAFVPFDEPALTENHEAGAPETIDLSASLGLLQQGTNVLAVQCHNRTLTSSDLSIIPELFSGEVRQCSPFVFQDSSARLYGYSNAAHTVAVRVNQTPASWDPITAEWEADVSLERGLNQVLVEALDENLRVRESLVLPVYREADFVAVSGTLSSNQTWTESAGPYHVSGSLTVPSGVTLQIGPGTTVFLDAGAIIQVNGNCRAEGTAEAPIRFLPWDCSPWDRIEVASTSSQAVFNYCEFRGGLAAGGSGYVAALTLVGAHGEVDHCLFQDCGKGIEVNSGGSLECTDTRMIDMLESIHSQACYCLIDSCTFVNTIGYSDSIDFDGNSSPTSRVTNCFFSGGEDDCIDTSNTDLLVEGNIITGYDSDDSKGLSLEGGSPVVRNNLIYACDIGVAIKDNCDPYMDHNTMVDNRIAIHSYNKLGTGPGFGTLISSIVWDNDTPVLLEDGSQLVVLYSALPVAVAGEGNINADPMFRNPQARNYHLRPGSPAIGAGEDGTDMGAFPVLAQPPERSILWQLY